MKNIFILLLLFAALATGSRAQQPGAESKAVLPATPDQQVCVLGNVMKPSAISFKDTISLTRAIGEAGGASPNLSHRVLIFRQLPDGYIRQIQIKDLKAMLRGRVADVALQPDDIVVVSSRDKRTRIAPQTSTPCNSRLMFLLRMTRL